MINSMETFNESEWNEYRKAHPEMRFFQGLRNYMDVGYIYLKESDNEKHQLKDTFYIKDEETSKKTK